ncbi:MAG: A/G-specific adenine glycosylase [Ignavibacteriales bacterium]|nr:A/G-specific adenine glycosylase [Ignavibacteriales bacterium]
MSLRPTVRPATPQLRRRILAWYQTNARNLPWRKTKNPYRILISEVMLQQTQVTRVLEKYHRFIRRFTSFEVLARASAAEVIRAWSGMGYNNRSVRLRELARIVRDRFNGRLPSRVDELLLLPGIGRYTAHAVACFAFGQRVPLADTNIARVLARLFPGEGPDPWSIADRILPRRHVYEWNQALMELGATICTAARPKCTSCPVVRMCPSAFSIAARKATLHKKERGRNGIPNRIYRGRIIELLRKSNSRGRGLMDIGRGVKPNFSAADHKWLVTLLAGLERDGLIQSRNRGNSVVLRLAS